MTHTNDPVPLIVPRVLGYRHQGTEYWQSVDPASAAIVKKCSVANDKEDPTCSLSTILNTNADSHSTVRSMNCSVGLIKRADSLSCSMWASHLVSDSARKLSSCRRFMYCFVFQMQFVLHWMSMRVSYQWSVSPRALE